MTKADSTTGYDTDSSQDSRDKGSVSSSRSRSRGWKPMRETLNVDSIFSETEKKQRSPKHKANLSSKPKHEKEQSLNSWPKENQSQKGLMTIYEDETKQETGSRSSLDSEGKGNAEKVKGFAERKVHTDSWQIQRTESGYESSDHISNGSTTLDSPIVEGTSPVDAKGVKEPIPCSDQNLTNKYVESVLQSASHQNGNYLDGLRKDQINMEAIYRPHNFPSESHLQTHRPALKRMEMHEGNRKFFPPVTSLPTSKDHINREMKINKLNEQNSSQWLNSDILERAILPVPITDITAGSFNKENSGVCEKTLNSNEFLSPNQLQSTHTRTIGSKPMLPIFLQQNMLEQSCTEPFSSGEWKIGTLGRTDNSKPIPEVIYQNLPPPLPPKKYALNTLPGSENESRVDLKLTEVQQNNPSNFERHITSTPSKATSEAG
uniref:Uncharacterized protein n=1 Tax=Sphenodon punctatus TaxID=8508 RepID=A0A8D0GS63_SPHPU